jgi:hypothetical protein
MTDDKWLTILERVKEQFSVLDEGVEEFDDRPGTMAFMTFVGPGDQKMRVERMVYPPVIGKNTSGSRRIGSDTRVEYQYSDTDMVDRLGVSRWSNADDAWVEVKGDMGTAFF